MEIKEELCHASGFITLRDKLISNFSFEEEFGEVSYCGNIIGVLYLFPVTAIEGTRLHKQNIRFRPEQAVHLPWAFPDSIDEPCDTKNSGHSDISAFALFAATAVDYFIGHYDYRAVLQELS